MDSPFLPDELLELINKWQEQRRRKPPLQPSAPSSNIGRVVRCSGRKDRHSKVSTARGTKDRRVRLSPRTAIQFYDVQDRLGYDRPSKAIDWLMKEATAAIDALRETPPLQAPTPPSEWAAALDSETEGMLGQREPLQSKISTFSSLGSQFPEISFSLEEFIATIVD